MLNKYFKLKFFLPVFALFLFASCNTDELYEDDPMLDALIGDIETLNAQEYTADLAEIDLNDEWEPEMQRFRGKRPCFKLVFPVTINFPDNTSETFENREEMREAMHAWKENQENYDTRPVFDFPINVILKNGKEATILKQEELDALKKDCFDGRPPLPRWRLCFKPLFPLDVKYPDGTVINMEDLETFRAAMREWKENNPDSDVHPVILFTLTIVLDENDQPIEINNFDELKEYLKDCIEKLRKKKGKKGKKGGKGGGN